MYRNLEKNSLESLLIFNSECKCNLYFGKVILRSELNAMDVLWHQFPLLIILLVYICKIKTISKDKQNKNKWIVTLL